MKYQKSKYKTETSLKIHTNYGNNPTIESSIREDARTTKISECISGINER